MEYKTSIPILLFVCFALAPLSGSSDFGKALSFGGTFKDVEIYRSPEDGAKTYAYVAQGANLYVYDITDLENPQKINQFQNGMDSFSSLAIDNGILAVGAGVKGTYLYSLERPDNPTLLTSIDEYSNTKVRLYGSNLIATQGAQMPGGPSSMRVSHRFFDLSVPSHPRQYYCFSISITGGPKYLSFHPVMGESNPCVLFGNYNMFIKSPIRFEIQKDRQGKTTDAVVSEIQDFPYSPAFSSGDVGYVSHENRLAAYDLSTPTQAIELSSISYKSCSGGALTDGVRIYQPIEDGRRVSVISVDASHNMKELGRIDVPFTPQKVRYGIGCKIEPTKGIRLIDLELSQETLLLGNIDGDVIGYLSNASDGDILVAVDHRSENDKENKETVHSSLLSFYTLKDALHPKKVGSFICPERAFVVRCENQILALDTRSGIRLYDVSDCERPVLASIIENAHCNRRESIFLHRNHLYLKNYDRNIIPYWTCYSIESLQNPIEKGKVTLPENLRRYAKYKNFIYYLSDDGLHLNAVEIANPLTINRHSNLYTFPKGHPSNNQFYIDGNALYVSKNNETGENSNFIYIFDITQPSRPLFTKRLLIPFENTPWAALSFFKINNRRLFVCGDRTVQAHRFHYPYIPLYVYDIRDSNNPKTLAYFTIENTIIDPLIQTRNNVIVMSPRLGYYVVPLID